MVFNIWYIKAQVSISVDFYHCPIKIFVFSNYVRTLGGRKSLFGQEIKAFKITFTLHLLKEAALTEFGSTSP